MSQSRKLKEKGDSKERKKVDRKEMYKKRQTTRTEIKESMEVSAP